MSLSINRSFYLLGIQSNSVRLTSCHIKLILTLSHAAAVVCDSYLRLSDVTLRHLIIVSHA